MADPEVPVVHTLIRPVVAGRYTTLDWDELRELADEAAEHAGPSDTGWKGAYAEGVQDALRWLADGIPTPALLRLLGGR